MMALKNANMSGSRQYSQQITNSRQVLDEFDELAGIGGDDANGSAGDRNAFLVEHLATFTVTRETGIVYPADGMRRLLQLEKSNGIWSQKMQLCLDGQWVLIMDYETGSIMERFPATLIQEPTAFTSSDPVELYNNIVAFVVGTGNDRGERGRSEMHIFQCHNVNAQDLVEDLKMLKGVGSTTSGRLSHIDSGSEGAGARERDFAIEREREREAEERPRRGPMTAHLYRERGSDSEAPGVGHEDEASSTSSDRLYEQDIAILNRCFDDIEKFIARLQHAAAASRELERRRRSRKSKKQTDPGEGMLVLRTRAPPERDFVDVLQKFKLSFNLLAKLRAHIHDPNAPELVHFLFTPLALIVDASADSGAGGRLAARVVQPLLTREALNLLANCVTSKETELWHSLGDAWLVPREQWKSAVPPYQPVFMDGWTPDYQVDDQPIQRPSPRRSEVPVSTFQPYSGDEQDPYGEQYSPYPRGTKAGPPRPTGDSGSATSSPDRDVPPPQASRYTEPPHDTTDRGPPKQDDGDEELGASWAREAAARGARIVRVTYPRTANNDKELTVVRGEYLEILDDSRKWWKARNSRGVTAHVPHTIVAPTQYARDEPAHVYPNPVYGTPNYQEQSGASTGVGGASVVSPPAAPADWIRRERLGKKDSTSSSEGTFPISRGGVPPPPPPPPPPLVTPSATLSKNGTLSSKSMKSLNTGEGIQEELKQVLTLYRERRPKFDIKKTPDLFIQQTSTPQEVQKWLEGKGFEESTQRRLRIPGYELFALSRQNLETIVGNDEGKRLYSQILVQRNVSGYKTTSSSELQSILRKVREKVEVVN